ncbi:MAG: hypothetical protein FD180_1144 [Planctomycetota bacterium]|nr:MAG: hypothetical protein FD180_1144 [Planctomycetota bacterium]
MRNMLRLAPIPMLLALAVLTAAEPEPAPRTPEDKPMPAVPPIDAAAPAKFETATFALG